MNLITISHLNLTPANVPATGAAVSAYTPQPGPPGRVVAVCSTVGDNRGYAFARVTAQRSRSAAQDTVPGACGCAASDPRTAFFCHELVRTCSPLLTSVRRTGSAKFHPRSTFRRRGHRSYCPAGVDVRLATCVCGRGQPVC